MCNINVFNIIINYYIPAYTIWLYIIFVDMHIVKWTLLILSSKNMFSENNQNGVLKWYYSFNTDIKSGRKQFFGADLIGVMQNNNLVEKSYSDLILCYTIRNG